MLIPRTDVDHAPHVHPAAPDNSLPESFAQYRNRAIQHGPLGGGGGGGGSNNRQNTQSAISSHASSPSGGIPEPYGGIGGHTGRQLGLVQPAKGEVWDRNELPARFRRRPWSEAEMEAVDSAGASMS